MVKSSQLNTMETFLSGFRIKRDGKVYTLTSEEMFDFRFLDNALTGQNCLDNYRDIADEDEADVIDKIRNDEEIDSGNLKITNLDRLIFTKNGEFTI